MKNMPVLTVTCCAIMERVRTVLEVQIGKRIIFLKLDFNTELVWVRAGDKDFEVSYDFSSYDKIHFSLDGKWYCGLFESTFVKVGCESDANDHVCKTIAGDFAMRWVGSSFAERHEEPLFLEDAQYCAQVRGLSLQELLDSKPL